MEWLCDRHLAMILFCLGRGACFHALCASVGSFCLKVEVWPVGHHFYLSSLTVFDKSRRTVRQNEHRNVLRERDCIDVWKQCPSFRCLIFGGYV
jgi:hypothetical protein